MDSLAPRTRAQQTAAPVGASGPTLLRTRRAAGRQSVLNNTGAGRSATALRITGPPGPRAHQYPPSLSCPIQKEVQVCSPGNTQRGLDVNACHCDACHISMRNLSIDVSCTQTQYVAVRAAQTARWNCPMQDCVGILRCVDLGVAVHTARC